MTKRLGRWLGAGALVAVALLAAGLTVLRLTLDEAAQEIAAAAQETHPGDPVEALVRLAASEEEPLHRRNQAVWALGQIGGELRDERALPHLETLHVQEECDHERLVCQREVRKAMAKIRGELSLRGSIRSAWQALRARYVGGSAGASMS